MFTSLMLTPLLWKYEALLYLSLEEQVFAWVVNILGTVLLKREVYSPSMSSSKHFFYYFIYRTKDAILWCLIPLFSYTQDCVISHYN